MDDRWLSVDEVARQLGVSKDSVNGCVTGPGIPRYTVGGLWKFRWNKGEAWVRAGGSGPGKRDREQESH